MSTHPRPPHRRPQEGVDDTDIHQDLAYQEREWRVQRAGWVFMAAIVLAALLGVLGLGPLNGGTASAGSALEVSYERFRRLQAPGVLELHLAAPPGARQVQLSVNDAYLKAVRVESVTPDPASVAGDGTRVVYTFNLLPEAQTLAVTMRFWPQRFGLFRAELGSSGHTVSFTQVVFP